MKYTITVTKADFTGGTLRSQSDCAFSRAISRAFDNRIAFIRDDRRVVILNGLPRWITRGKITGFFNFHKNLAPKNEEEEFKKFVYMSGTMGETDFHILKGFDRGYARAYADYKFELELEEPIVK